MVQTAGGMKLLVPAEICSDHPGQQPCRLQGRSSSCCLQGYTLGNAQLDFTINIAINYTMGNTTTSETIQINPSVPFVLSSSQQVSAQLLGDLESYTALPVLSTMYLMIPHPQSEFWGLLEKLLMLMDLSAKGDLDCMGCLASCTMLSVMSMKHVICPWP